MSMSKKDFIALADAINTTVERVRILRHGAFTRGKIVISRDSLIKLVADFCEQQSPNFKRERWIAYVNGECGPNGGPVKREISPIDGQYFPRK